MVLHAKEGCQPRGDGQILYGDEKGKADKRLVREKSRGYFNNEEANEIL